MDTKLFEEIGFTKGEIKTYFALLKLGETTIGPLSSKAGITPAKTYPILDKLIDKGLINYVIRSGTKYFQTLDPNRIIDFLNEKEEKIKQEKEKVEKILPTLIAEQNNNLENYAIVYEGFNGIKTLYDEMLRYLVEKKESFRSFTMGEEYMNENINLFFSQQDIRRKELGIKIKLIGMKDQKRFLNKLYKKDPNIEIRYVEHTTPSGVIIYGDNVVTLLWKDKPFAFRIHSEQNARSYLKFFEDMWNSAKN